MATAEKTPEQIAAEAAAAKAAAEKKAADDAKKAEEKRLKDEAAAKAKQEKKDLADAKKKETEEKKAADKKAKADKAAADKQAKVDAAAKKKSDAEQAKKDAAAAKLANQMPEQNGVRRPKPDSLCGKAWGVMDAESAKLGSPVPIKELLDVTNKLGLNEGNVRAEYARWRKFFGVTGRIVTAKPEAPKTNETTGTSDGAGTGAPAA